MWQGLVKQGSTYLRAISVAGWERSKVMHGSDASRHISVSDQGDYPYPAGCKGRGISVVVVAAEALKPSNVNRLFGWHRLGGRSLHDLSNQ